MNDKLYCFMVNCKVVFYSNYIDLQLVMNYSFIFIYSIFLSFSTEGSAKNSNVEG